MVKWISNSRNLGHISISGKELGSQNQLKETEKYETNPFLKINFKIHYQTYEDKLLLYQVKSENYIFY